eukprot:752309-Hanusia_phi.AAC.1
MRDAKHLEGFGIKVEGEVKYDREKVREEGGQRGGERRGARRREGGGGGGGGGGGVTVRQVAAHADQLSKNVAKNLGNSLEALGVDVIPEAGLLVGPNK